MNDTETSIEVLFEKAENYGKTSVELFKLNAIDRSADVASSFVALLALSIVVLLSVLSINIGLALWLGELMGKTYYGFFVITGFYVLAGIAIYLFRNQWIKTPVSNFIILQMLKHKPDEK